LRGDAERQTLRGERNVLLIGHADKIAEMAQFHVPTSIPRGLLRAIPKAIVSFSPALLDEIGLRWVPNHELRSTLKGLNSCARNGEATQTEFR